jgi:oxaloacetate decarboxylase alpha subunit
VTVNGKEYAVAVAPGTAEPIAINETGSSAAVVGEAVVSSGQTIKAPMPGSVFKLLVAIGDSVAPGDTVIILEAMKMEIEVKSTEAGVVSSLLVGVGDTISADQDLLAL